MMAGRPWTNSARFLHQLSTEYAKATFSGSRLFQPFSARRTFSVAVSCVKGGSGARCADSFAVFIILLRTAIGQSLESSIPELLHKGCRQANDFARLLIQRKMSRVENMHLNHFTLARFQKYSQLSLAR